MPNKKLLPRPFLKWAGSKKQLLAPIKSCMLQGLSRFRYRTFVDGFMGSGAVTFMVLNELSEVGCLHQLIANDSNEDLVQCFKTVKESLGGLLDELKRLEKGFRRALVPADYYRKIRSHFNDRNNCSDPVERSAAFIFLNHTCFNGLYRVNSLGDFNVPFNQNPNSKIFDQEILEVDSEAFNTCSVFFLTGDYQVDPSQYLDRPDETLFYFDPPYRPITQTSSFHKYTKCDFGDAEQLRLAEYCVALCKAGAGVIASNSHTTDDYYRTHYSGFRIDVVQAVRFVNACVSKRGIVSEVLLSRFGQGFHGV